MADTHTIRIFKRVDGDPKQYWHWRPDCLLWQALASMKKRGKIIIYESATLRPTTYRLCPGCTAIDDRIRTRAYPYVTPKPDAIPPNPYGPNPTAQLQDGTITQNV